MVVASDVSGTPHPYPVLMWLINPSPGERSQMLGRRGFRTRARRAIRLAFFLEYFLGRPQRQLPHDRTLFATPANCSASAFVNLMGTILPLAPQDLLPYIYCITIFMGLSSACGHEDHEPEKASQYPRCALRSSPRSDFGHTYPLPLSHLGH